MCGVLDKSQFGASQYGFVHSCHEVRLLYRIARNFFKAPNCH